MQWVSDPARTSDELFTVEIILEGVRGYNWPFHYVDKGFEAQRERRRERKLNPAHRPALHPNELRELNNRRDTLQNFSGAYGEDRPLRDLKALSFFPALESLSVESSDVTDFTPLAGLKNVKNLYIHEWGDLYGCHPICLAECGEMPALERLSLALRHPWPDVRAISRWKTLLDIRFSGNVLALEGMERFPAARVVHLKNWISGDLPLRNLRTLPLVPEVRQLTIDETASLEGIDRYPRVVNLDIKGIFRDLTPLATMEKITALILRSEKFHDLRPLAGMKALREITFVREWPLDLAPLAGCPELRRVEYRGCPMMRTEVAALNAGLPPEADDFLAETPRPLKPLKFFRLEKENEAGRQYFGDRQRKIEADRERFYDGDEALRKGETRVFCAAMQAEFDALLGRGWGLFKSHFVRVKRYQDTQRVVELVEIVRRFSARSRFPQHITFIVQPHGDMSEEMEEMRERDAKANDPDAEFVRPYDIDRELAQEEEDRRLREERDELLKREHLLRLRGEEAAELSYLAKAEPEPDDEPEAAEPLTAGDQVEGEGGLAIAESPPALPDEETQDLSEELTFYLEVYEDCAVCGPGWAEAAAYTMAESFIPWTPEEAAC
jgi:hypothetical protein